jgi:hypothetical protein
MDPTAAENTSGRKRPPEWAVWLIGFAISLAVGLVFDHLTNKDILDRIENAQRGWIKAAEATTPFTVADTYWKDLQEAWRGRPLDQPAYDFDDARGAGIWSPFVALVSTGESAVRAGGLTALLQLALGALGIATFNYTKSQGRSIFFEDPYMNILLGPVAIIAAASVIGLALWLVMWAALHTLGNFITVASSLCGTCGVAGFCSYCGKKLAEKHVEHALTPKF